MLVCRGNFGNEDFPRVLCNENCLRVLCNENCVRVLCNENCLRVLCNDNCLRVLCLRVLCNEYCRVRDSAPDGSSPRGCVRFVESDVDCELYSTVMYFLATP